MVLLPAVSYNQDHEAVFRAGFTACRPHVPDYKPFQTHRPRLRQHLAVSWSMERERFHPHVYVDISNTSSTSSRRCRSTSRSCARRSTTAASQSVEYWARVRGREILGRGGRGLHVPALRAVSRPRRPRPRHGRRVCAIAPAPLPALAALPGQGRPRSDVFVVLDDVAVQPERLAEPQPLKGRTVRSW